MNALLCQGSLLKCSFGLAPGALSVLPQNKVNTCSLAAANIMSNVPMENIPSFGICVTLLLILPSLLRQLQRWGR